MKITKGKKTPKGVFGIIYGPEGIGKTTLAASLPSPLFLDAENGSSGIDVSSIDTEGKPVTFAGLKAIFKELANDHGEYKTLVLDSADFIETEISTELAKENSWESLNTPGYGKGYDTMAEARFIPLLEMSKRLIDRGMNVFWIAHTQIKKFELPDERGSFDRYSLKLYKKNEAKIKEASDLIIFCNWKTTIVNADKKNGETKNHASGSKRWCYTVRSAAYDAKRRTFIDLPDECALDKMTELLSSAISKATSGSTPSAEPPKQEKKPEPAPAPAEQEQKIVKENLPPYLQNFFESMIIYEVSEEKLRERFADQFERKLGDRNLPFHLWPEAFCKMVLNRGILDELSPKSLPF